jgi:uncharacterized membrane protein
MDFLVLALCGAAALVAGMIACGEAGRRLALRRAAHDRDGTWSGIGVVDGAVFALFGLVIAFTFSGAVSRFDARRDLIIKEVNAIGTAWLRVDLLPEASQPAVRDSFRRYVDSRIQTYRLLPDLSAAMAEFENSQRLQAEIWSRAVTAAPASHTAIVVLVPALNEMFDITTTRTLMTRVHPPFVIFVMLFVLALVCAALAGYSMAQSPSRDWLHMAAFALVIGLAFYVILDIEYPRLGLIRVSALDQALVDLRASMK